MASNSKPLVDGIDVSKAPEGTGTITIGSTVQGTEEAEVREEQTIDLGNGLTLVRR